MGLPNVSGEIRDNLDLLVIASAYKPRGQNEFFPCVLIKGSRDRVHRVRKTTSFSQRKNATAAARKWIESAGREYFESAWIAVWLEG